VTIAKRRAAADPIDGVLALDKPLGVSSNTALQQARRLLQARKAGHTGTLDPLASGLLPLTFGEATKFSADLLDADKDYEAQLALGAVTTTGDAEGEVTERRPVNVSAEHFCAVLTRFLGCREQVPPMHSALKRDGRPLYELARLGQEVVRAPRPISITRLALLRWDPLAPVVEVTCSKGTYVRVLAEEIGAALGCGAHLQALRRTRVGPLHLAQAVTLEQLQASDVAGRRLWLLPMDTLLASLPSVILDAAASARFAHGQRVPHEGEFERGRVYGADGTLMGVARCAGGWLEAARLVAQAAAAAAPTPAGAAVTTAACQTIAIEHRIEEAS
jgi:tRNA pseudouridine55 synthase